MKLKKNIILITVIIPAYNSEKFISKCIDSVPEEKEIEIIIIDDFSKVNLKDQINFKKYSNIKIYRNKSNLGPGPSRNLGIKYALGDYLLFLDSDDTLVKANILKLVKQIKKGRKVDLYFCRYNKDNFPKDNLFFLKMLPKKINREMIIKKMIKKNYPMDECWSILFNKNFLIKNKIFFPKNIMVAEDEYFLMKVMTRFNTAKKFIHLIYIHNDRDGSLSSNLSNYKSHVDFINLFYLFCKLYLYKNYNKTENLLFLYYLKTLYSRIFLLLSIRSENELLEISKLIKKNYSSKIPKTFENLKLDNYNILTNIKNIFQLKNLIIENKNNFEKKYGTPKNIFIYCKGLLAKSLIKICESLGTNIVAIVDDKIDLKKEPSKYKLISSHQMIKIINKKKLSYKVFIANNRPLTFKKIKKELIKNKIRSKDILHFY